MDQNGLFDKMVNEAMNIVSSTGWQQAPQNAVTLAAFGMMSGKVRDQINRLVSPAWTIAVSIGLAVIWWVLSSVFGIK